MQREIESTSELQTQQKLLDPPETAPDRVQADAFQATSVEHWTGSMREDLLADKAAMDKIVLGEFTKGLRAEICTKYGVSKGANEGVAAFVNRLYPLLEGTDTNLTASAYEVIYDDQFASERNKVAHEYKQVRLARAIVDTVDGVKRSGLDAWFDEKFGIKARKYIIKQEKRRRTTLG